MARSHPVRKGVQNLQVVVIALSLAVLALLALVTAQAGARLSERQADELHQVYAAEAAGQQFLAVVDAQLDQLRQSSADPQQMMRMLDAAAQSCAQAAASAQEAAEAGTTGEAHALTPEQSATPIEHLAPTGQTIGVLIGSFTTEQNQNLTCTLAIHADATYEVIGWKQAKLWSDDANSERLLITE